MILSHYIVRKQLLCLRCALLFVVQCVFVVHCSSSVVELVFKVKLFVFSLVCESF
jgi:hypothetical protein